MSPKNKKKAKRVVSFYWQHAKKYKLGLWLTGIFVPIAVLSNNQLPALVLARVLDRLSRQDFVAGQPWQSFTPELIIYTLLTLSSGLVFWRIVDLTVWRVEAKVQSDLAKEVFTHYIDQSADFHANNFGGSLVSGNNKLLGSYVRIADTTIFGVMPLIVSILAAVVILAKPAPLFAAVMVIFSIIYVAISYKVSEPVRRAGAAHAAQESRQTGELADAITNAMAIKSFATDKFEIEKFGRTAETTRQRLLGVMVPHQRQMIYFTVMSSTITAGSLALAILSVVTFGANIATAFLIFNYTANIIAQLFNFSNQLLRNYNRAIGDASDTVDILLSPPDVVDPKKPEKVRIHRGAIQFDKVVFRHKGANEAIFDKLNVGIKPGEKVGLVGHSGSGKTTFTRLLLRFSDISKGKIKIDGQDISKITQNDLRSHIAYVPQEPLLFHRTIAENIAYSNTGASMDEIRAIARKANAAEFIEKLADGYDTLVGERGIKLSGGQRQRIAIARAMLKNAPILVLDEATSALDSESEGLIQDALWKLMEGRTAIVIAHRLSTIQRMDRILVMDKGKIVEEGTHRELIRKEKGIYAKLWEKQSGGFIDDDGE